MPVKTCTARHMQESPQKPTLRKIGNQCGLWFQVANTFEQCFSIDLCRLLPIKRSHRRDMPSAGQATPTVSGSLPIRMKKKLTFVLVELSYQIESQGEIFFTYIPESNLRLLG